MRTFTKGLLFTCVTVALSATANSKAAKEEATGPSFEIQSYRFSRNLKKDSERLVLEFKEKGHAGTPQVKVSRKTGTNEAVVEVENASLIGAIPESAINDAFSAKSHHLATVSMSTDTPAKGFSLKSQLKNEAAVVEAFWVDHPARLVLDLKTAAHHETPSVKEIKEVQIEEPEHEREVAARRARPAPTHTVVKAPKKEDFLCFPTTAQVGLSVTFQPKTPKEDVPRVRIDLDAAQAAAADSTSDAIVCYPASSQVFASISFHEPHDAAGFAGNLPATAEKSPFTWNSNPPTEKAAEPARQQAAAPVTPVKAAPVFEERTFPEKGEAPEKREKSEPQATNRGLFQEGRLPSSTGTAIKLPGAPSGKSRVGDPGALLPPAH